MKLFGCFSATKPEKYTSYTPRTTVMHGDCSIPSMKGIGTQCPISGNAQRRLGSDGSRFTRIKSIFCKCFSEKAPSSAPERHKNDVQNVRQDSTEYPDLATPPSFSNVEFPSPDNTESHPVATRPMVHELENRLRSDVTPTSRGNRATSSVVSDGLCIALKSNLNKRAVVSQNDLSGLEGATNGEVTSTSVRTDANGRPPIPRTINSRSFVTYRYGKNRSNTGAMISSTLQVRVSERYTGHASHPGPS